MIPRSTLAVFVTASWILPAPLAFAQVPVPPAGATQERTTATSAPPDDARPAIRQDDDEPDYVGVKIGSWLTLAGSVMSDGHALASRGLADDDAATLDSQAQVRALVSPGKRWRAFAKAGVARNVAVRDGETVFDEWRPSVEEAYVEWDVLRNQALQVQAGRQRFKDTQEWFFDDYLDAVRVKSRLGRWRFEVAYADGLTRQPDDLRAEDDRQHVIASVSRRVTRAARFTAYLVQRNDRSAREDTPTWLGAGLSSRGERMVTYRAVAAVRRGSSQQVRLRGWAADGAVTLRLPWRAAPAVTGGYAWGSGDASTSDGVDSGFRQTGLQDNSVRFGTWRRMRMYGEVFDPELANLKIATAALGWRIGSSIGVDLVFHDYRQVVARRRLADQAFDRRPNGRSNAVGREVDVQVVARLARRIDLLLAGGMFLPGSAFAQTDGGGKPTLVLRPQIRVFF